MVANSTSPVSGSVSVFDLLKRPQITYDMLSELDPDSSQMTDDISREVEIMVKYEDYIQRQKLQVEKFKKTESRIIPDDFDYEKVKNLRIEAKQKLSAQRPVNLGQASRISGVSPADINALLIELMKIK